LIRRTQNIPKPSLHKRSVLLSDLIESFRISPPFCLSLSLSLSLSLPLSLSSALSLALSYALLSLVRLSDCLWPYTPVYLLNQSAAPAPLHLKDLCVCVCV